MTSIGNIVSVSITKATAGVSRTGFGTPLIMSVEADTEARFADTAKVYTALDELGSTGDGYDTGGVTYKMAQAVFAQNPKVTQIVIGKRATTPTQTIDFTPVAKNSTLYRLSISGADDLNDVQAETNFDFTSDATATAAEIATGLFDAISQTAWANTTAYSVGEYVNNDSGKVYMCTEAGTSDGSGGPTGTGSAIEDGTVTWEYKGPVQYVKPTDNTGSFTIERGDGIGAAGSAAAGKAFYVGTNDDNLFGWQDTTPDAGISTDIQSVRNNADGNDDWYCVLLDTNGKAEIDATADYVETTGYPGKFFVAATADADILTTASDDIASTLAGLGYDKTAILWHHDPYGGPDAAFAGNALPYDPGEITWAYQKLTGQSASTGLTSSEINNMDGKNCNRYVQVTSSLTDTATLEGTAISGEFIDVTRGIDFLVARMQEDIFSALLNNKKIPFTNAGIGLIESKVRGVLNLGIAQGILSDDPESEPTVTVPLSSAVTSANKSSRTLELSFDATLAGAIHNVTITGTITV